MDTITLDDRFARLLDAAPLARPYWDLIRRQCDADALRRDLRAWSHGERIMALFVLSVWRGEVEPDLDLLDVAAVLDRGNRAVVADWLLAPFWP